jgi:large subunit ribosomal protein L4
MKAQVISLDNKKGAQIELDDAVFATPFRRDIIARVVDWQRAKARSGNHKTKGISDISGTTKKPFKQKGTGRARQGSLRAPQFRGGATIFGPVVRSHEYSLPKKVRKLGLKSALSEKFANGKAFVVSDLKMDAPKTAELTKKLKSLGWSTVLFIDGDQVNENFLKASANLYKIDILPQIGANVYDILNHEYLAITEEAARKLEERLK